jgi:hypothetical protein
LHDVWSKHCRKNTGSSNSYTGKDGRSYFFEVSRREHDDGAITGTSWKHVTQEGHVRRAGSWRINGDGTVARYPTSWPFPKDSALEVAPMFTLPDKDICTACRTAAEYGDKFCSQCGTRLSTIDAPLA